MDIPLQFRIRQQSDRGLTIGRLCLRPDLLVRREYIVERLEKHVRLYEWYLHNGLPRLPLPVLVRLEVWGVVLSQWRRRFEHELGQGVGEELGALGGKDGQELGQGGEGRGFAEGEGFEGALLRLLRIFVAAVRVSVQFVVLVELAQVDHVGGEGGVEVGEVPVPGGAAGMVICQDPMEALEIIPNVPPSPPQSVLSVCRGGTPAKLCLVVVIPVRPRLVVRMKLVELLGGLGLCAGACNSGGAPNLCSGVLASGGLRGAALFIRRLGALGRFPPTVPRPVKVVVVLFVVGPHAPPRFVLLVPPPFEVLLLECRQVIHELFEPVGVDIFLVCQVAPPHGE
mmetsp:Transcript_6835/g.20368  ORF Transcript_6835/g.20368 Transcript_6835/m.20368 type:complete len:340 (-) Transcript_6835:2679-3698(-)